MLWKPIQSLWIFFITILEQPEVETKASNWNINCESLFVVVEWGKAALPQNYDKQVWQTGLLPAAAVPFRQAGSLWIGSVISTSHPGAIIINLVCLLNEY